MMLQEPLRIRMPTSFGGSGCLMKQSRIFEEGYCALVGLRLRAGRCLAVDDGLSRGSSSQSV